MSAMSALASEVYRTTGLHPWEHDDEGARFIREADMAGDEDALHDEMDADEQQWVYDEEVRACCGGRAWDCSHYGYYPPERVYFDG